MGLKPYEVKKLTLKEFDLMLTGYNRRQEREWDRTRHLLSFIQAFAGMGASEYTPPHDLFPLSLDNENKKRMITTLAQAKALYKEFVN
jgi:hypothetical protein